MDNERPANRPRPTRDAAELVPLDELSVAKILAGGTPRRFRDGPVGAHIRELPDRLRAEQARALAENRRRHELLKAFSLKLTELVAEYPDGRSDYLVSSAQASLAERICIDEPNPDKRDREVGYLRELSGVFLEHLESAGEGY